MFLSRTLLTRTKDETPSCVAIVKVQRIYMRYKDFEGEDHILEDPAVSSAGAKSAHSENLSTITCGT